MTQQRTRQWVKRLGLAGVASVALVAGGLAATASASSALSALPTVNPYSPAYGHPYRHGVVPTQETKAQMDAWSAAHPSASIKPDSAQNLRFGGGVDGIGVTNGVPQVYIVFWGSGWGTQSTDANGNMTFSTDPSGAAPKVQNMFKGLGTGGELWSGIATQYCEGVPVGTQICGTAGSHVGMPTAGVLSGVWYDNSNIPLTNDEHTIAVEAVTAASHFGNTTPALNRLAQYVIFSPTGYHPDNFNAPLQWCAWHDWNGDPTLIGGPAPSTVGDIAFTNMPYVLDAHASCGQNFVNAGSAGTLDGFTIVEGHEYAETITDQNPAGGYTDTSGAENMDKCAWRTPGTQGGAANVSMGNGSYAEQGGWSNDSVGGTGQCEIAHAVVTGGGGGCTAAQLLGNPGFESGNVTWSSTAGVITNTGEPPHSGAWKAKLDGYGVSHTDTLSQSVTIPSGCASYTLSFWLHITTAETGGRTRDTMTVKLGSTTLATYSNRNAAAGYSQKTFNVSGFAGQTVTLLFTGVENNSRATTFVVDDTALNVA